MKNLVNKIEKLSIFQLFILLMIVVRLMLWLIGFLIDKAPIMLFILLVVFVLWLVYSLWR
ncbi:MAG: hypothetical protein EWM50_07615 [Gottschalkiaceae bacterium]|nr:MAG: hypothetical protein EWM50_07615 [Gottschalkiaceae bacterium]